MPKIGKTGPIIYDPERHCGHIKKNGQRCLLIHGQGTGHLGQGCCRVHGGLGNNKGIKTGIYADIRRNRFGELLARAKQSDPSSIIDEVYGLRALAMNFLESDANLDDREDLMMAKDLLKDIIRAAKDWKEMQQSEMLHIKTVQLINMRMAEVVMAVIRTLDPANDSDWRDRAIERIKDQWSKIQIETSIKELKRSLEKAEEGELVGD